jgi:hypothetical protein
LREALQVSHGGSRGVATACASEGLDRWPYAVLAAPPLDLRTDDRTFTDCCGSSLVSARVTRARADIMSSYGFIDWPASRMRRFSVCLDASSKRIAGRKRVFGGTSSIPVPNQEDADGIVQLTESPQTDWARETRTDAA